MQAFRSDAHEANGERDLQPVTNEAVASKSARMQGGMVGRSAVHQVGGFEARVCQDRLSEQLVLSPLDNRFVYIVDTRCDGLLEEMSEAVGVDLKGAQ